jgi:hypothetical protein
MNYEAMKQRQRRAKARAAENLQRSDYKLGEEFDIVALRDNEIRLIRIVIGQASAEDIRRCRSIHVPNNCVREIWSVIDDTGKFEIKHIL